MRMLIPGLIGTLFLTGCQVGVLTSDCDDCNPDAQRILLVAEDRGQSATLTVEFNERESQVGQLGWHLTLDYPELDMTLDELQDMLDDRGYNVEVDNIECIRWNANYADGRYLCEGNDNTPYDADLIDETSLDWSDDHWNIDTWSDPSGQGCSAVACEE